MKSFGLTIACIALLAPSGASADWSLGDVKVAAIQVADWPGPDNSVYITFSAPPFPGCTRQEWRLTGTTQNQERNLSLLLAAHLANRTVRVFKTVACPGVANPGIAGIIIGEFVE